MLMVPNGPFRGTSWGPLMGLQRKFGENRGVPVAAGIIPIRGSYRRQRIFDAAVPLRARVVDA
jgi:hypothetical protein